MDYVRVFFRFGPYGTNPRIVGYCLPPLVRRLGITVLFVESTGTQAQYNVWPPDLQQVVPLLWLTATPLTRSLPVLAKSITLKRSSRGAGSSG